MTSEPEFQFNLDSLKRKLAENPRKQYWRTLGELAETPGFMESLADEVPQAARTMGLHVDRREFFTLAGASLALAGLSGCRYLPQDKIVPYVNQPEELTIGVPLFYATAVPNQAGCGVGAIVTAREGRPIKMEGNPGHPDSMGALDAYSQAFTLQLYDPDRSQVVLENGDFSSWQEFYERARALIDGQRATRGAGIRILTETVTSPTLAGQIGEILTAFPAAKWVQYEPMGRHAARAGAVAAFGRPVDTIYHLAGAKRIVSLDADFLLSMPGHLRYAHDFADGRRMRAGTTDMNRLYVVESAPSITGARGDDRLRVRQSMVPVIAQALAAQLGVPGYTAPGGLDAPTQGFVAAMAQDLQANNGASVVIPGDIQAPELHVIAHAINAHIGAVGSTVTYVEPVAANQQDQIADLKGLVADMNAGTVTILFVLSGNPIYNAPADVDMRGALSRVAFRARLSQYVDETSVACQWQLPESHPLEAWGDIRAYDGSATVQQPLILPLYESKSAYELLAGVFDHVTGAAAASATLAANRAAAAKAERRGRAAKGHAPAPAAAAPSTVAAASAGLFGARDGYTVIRDYWAAHGYPVEAPYDFNFNRLLHDGVVPGTASRPAAVTVAAGAAAAAPPAATVGGSNLEIMIRPDPTIWDGRYSNNGWLQELPKPLTRITWDNVALISPATAERYNIPLDYEAAGANNILQISFQGHTVKAPAWVLPGHPDDCLTLYLGYGRELAGAIGNGRGFPIYPVFFSNAPQGGLAQVTQTTEIYNIAVVQHHHTTSGRDVVRAGTLDEFHQDPTMALTGTPGPHTSGAREEALTHNQDLGLDLHQPNLYPRFNWPEKKSESFGAYAWGMSIDIQSCIGCNACLAACQAENNIPVVGKTQVMYGHHMNWIRIDVYYSSESRDSDIPLRNPTTYFQPVTCMQCEQAPCEPVCPVGATMHSWEGINQMVYNRCIGTRYCSNNCPYKVRRFNWLNYNNHFDIGVKKMLYNPDVTVRSRGVMEKCMYCIQRINVARQTAKIEGRELHDGEILTACQQTCPTNAIVFGNINDTASQVYKLKSQPHNYGMLADLNTRPRTTYLARVDNPNPAIAPALE